MNREIIFTIVFMVFAYIIGKYKLLPYFAAKKILKDAKTEKSGRQDNGATTVSPALPLQMPYAMPYGGYPVNLPQSLEKPSRQDMYFDCRVIATDLSMQDIGDAVTNAASDICITLRTRGTCPNALEVVSIGDGLILVYATYHM